MNQFKREFIDLHPFEWKILQSDSEKNSCIKHGIKQQFSAPYKHQQNLIERTIGTLQNVCRTLMLQYNVPETYNEDCIKFACTIMNQCRISTGMETTPHEALTGEKPRVIYWVREGGRVMNSLFQVTKKRAKRFLSHEKKWIHNEGTFENPVNNEGFWFGVLIQFITSIEILD